MGNVITHMIKVEGCKNNLETFFTALAPDDSKNYLQLSELIPQFSGETHSDAFGMVVNNIFVDNPGLFFCSNRIVIDAFKVISKEFNIKLTVDYTLHMLGSDGIMIFYGGEGYDLECHCFNSCESYEDRQGKVLNPGYQVAITSDTQNTYTFLRSLVGNQPLLELEAIDGSLIHIRSDFVMRMPTPTMILYERSMGR